MFKFKSLRRYINIPFICVLLFVTSQTNAQSLYRKDIKQLESASQKMTTSIWEEIEKAPPITSNFNYMLWGYWVSGYIVNKTGEKEEVKKMRYNLNSRELFFYKENDTKCQVRKLSQIQGFAIQLRDEHDNPAYRKYINGEGISQQDIPLEGLFEVVEEGAYRLLIKYQITSTEPYMAEEVIDDKKVLLLRNRKKESFKYIVNSKDQAYPISESLDKTFSVVEADLVKDIKNHTRKNKYKLHRRVDAQKTVRHLNKIYNTLQENVNI